MKRINSLRWPNLKKIGMTQSLIRVWYECHRKFLLTVNGFRSEIKGGAMAFGSFFHWMAENISYEKDAIVDVQSMVSAYSKNQKDYSDQQELEEHCGMMEPLFLNYVLTYAVDMKKHFICRERQVDVVWRGFRLMGKIDGLFRDEDGKLWIMEHKTKGRIDDQGLLLQLSMDFQIQYYRLLAFLSVGEWPIGVLYNVVRTPQLKRGKNETLQEFSQRIGVDIASRPEWYYKRWEIRYTDFDRTKFMRYLGGVLRDIARGDKTHNPFACSAQWGGCPYIEVCGKGCVDGLEKTSNIHPELS